MTVCVNSINVKDKNMFKTIPVRCQMDHIAHLVKVMIIQASLLFKTGLNRRGGIEVERSPRMRDIGVRSPVATDLSRKNR